jgi:hypothetical protein
MEMSTTEENVGFLHEGRSDELLFQDTPDLTFIQDKSGSADLADFLTRPVMINTFTWAEGSSVLLQQVINPWALFFNDLRIRKKLDNFAYIKCTLKLKCVINASPFYYGAIGAFYRPLSGSFNNLTSPSTEFRIQIPISQRPHVWLNPQEVSTAEMKLPFFSQNNYLNVNSAAAFTAFGQLDYWQFSQLRSANGAVGAGVTITTYAWAEDVVVAGPTVNLALQARTVSNAGDQWWKPAGPISGAASKVLSVTPMLGKMGAVGEYAGKTIEAVANSVGAVSSLFGFTNTPIIDDVAPMKSLSFQGIASTEIGQPAERLTIDPKQALDLDSTLVGLDGEDELGIAYLSGKESFLTGTLWQETMSADTLLFTARVMPQLRDQRVVTGGIQIYETPMSFVSRMFGKWRGDIIFRFKFIRSMYHRGRVRITWDPRGNISTDPASTTVAYTKIVDLDCDDEVELRVPYLALTPFLDCDFEAAELFNNFVTGSGALAPNAKCNGTITLRVLNKLTGPVAGSEIDVLVFVRAAENIEFAYPVELNPRISPFVMQSKTEVITNGSTSTADGIYGVVFGERYASLRQMLHRSTRAFSNKPYVMAGNLAANQITWFISATPETNGYDSTFGQHGAIGAVGGLTTAYNFIPNHPIAHLKQAFIGQRGSFTWNFNLDSAFAGTPAANLTVARSIAQPSTVRRMNNVTYDLNGAVAGKYAYVSTILDANCQLSQPGATGIAMTNQYTQGGVTVNYPDYNLQRFHINNPSIFARDTIGKMQVTTTVPLSEYSNTQLHGYCCAGPDFNLLFFLNTPDYYLYNVIPSYAPTEIGVFAQLAP